MPAEVRYETMSADDHATDDHPTDAHTTDAHGDDGHATDDHADAEEPLGPIDLRAWGAALLGVLLGAAIAASFAVTTNALG